MQFSELAGATLRIGSGGEAFDVFVPSSTAKWIDGLIQPSGEKVVIIVAQLPNDEDFDSYARDGVFKKYVPWIAPGLAAFLIARSGNAHILDRLGRQDWMNSVSRPKVGDLDSWPPNTLLN